MYVILILGILCYLWFTYTSITTLSYFSSYCFKFTSLCITISFFFTSTSNVVFFMVLDGLRSLIICEQSLLGWTHPFSWFLLLPVYTADIQSAITCQAKSLSFRLKHWTKHSPFQPSWLIHTSNFSSYPHLSFRNTILDTHIWNWSNILHQPQNRRM